MTARNPDLCRRIARAIAPLALSMPDRVVIAALVEEAVSFDGLPEWLRLLVRRGERESGR